MKNLITTFLFLYFVQAFAQPRPGVIYFNDGTSIKGYGEIKVQEANFVRKYVIEFKASLEDKPDEWDESMAKGITFMSSDEAYKFQYIVPGKREDPVLMEVMTEGNVSLYVDRIKMITSFIPVIADEATENNDEDFHMPELTEKDYVYVKKAMEEYPTLLNGNYKKKAMGYFSDCETLVQRIQDNKYSWKSMREIVEFYNDYCVE